MVSSGVETESRFASGDAINSFYGLHRVTQPESAYVEGDGIHGGECGKWIKFLVRKCGSLTQGVVRLYLEYADDAAFRSSVFLNHTPDERDLLRGTPSCFNNRLANNSVANSIEHTFVWDVCVVNNETYNVRYRVNKRGAYLLHVKLDGNSIPGSPFNIYISDASSCTAANRVYGRNVEKCVAIPYVQQITDSLFPDSSRHGSMHENHTQSPHVNSSSEKHKDGSPKGLSKVNAVKDCKLKFGSQSVDSMYPHASTHSSGAASQFTDMRKGTDEGTSMSDGTVHNLLNLWTSGNVQKGEEPSPKRSAAYLSNHKGGEQIDKDVQRHKPSETQITKFKTIEYLERCNLINEILVHLADVNGNVVTEAQPYVRAWGENYARVVSVDNRGDGVIVIKYIVVVPRKGVSLLKEAQSRSSKSMLPTSMRISGVPCKIHIEIDNKPVYGSPFNPVVENISEIERYYMSQQDLAANLIHKFEDLLRKKDFDGCFDLYNSCKEKHVKDNLTELLLSRLSELESSNIATTSDIRLVESLKLQSLGRLLELVKSQYKKMLTYKTSNIVNCIRELKSFEGVTDGKASRAGNGPTTGKKFNNLGDVILNYRLIGDELRKLHRYELADKFDKINDRMCDEIDVGMWQSIIKQKETHVQKLRQEVEAASERLIEFKNRMKNKYEKYNRVDLNELKKNPGFAIERSVQTEEPQLITTNLAPLVENRCTPTGGRNDVDLLVESHWRKCNNYDIQSTITKVLKSSVRLKNSISELFMYYGSLHPLDNERSIFGVSRASMELFVLEIQLNKYLISNSAKLQWLFERFSIDLSVRTPTDGRLSSKSLRIIPEHLWCAYLRELAYLNLLYTIAESGDKDMLRDLQHPSRLVAFYHLCKEHLVPLYEHLFTTKPEFQKFLKFADNKVTPGSKHTSKASKKMVAVPSEVYFNSRKDIIKYFTAKALEHVLQMLDLGVLELIFKHYSRISMHGRRQVSQNWYNDNATISTSTFVVFARDFQIIPGHIDGENVHEIAKSVVRSENVSSSDSKLKLGDFIKAVARTVGKAVLGCCLAKHDAYENGSDEFSLQSEGGRCCVQSNESVKRDIQVLIQSLGICDAQFARFTIDAIYGPEAMEYL
ncbi:hypothetical protein X943_000066 [Babesia divergens]|uniref:Uncharacterized protein n=1 Tax=Babesia divergens TaxID=32595 RepID=A0AAD9GCQ2_BABDI|nr:hypothetical protein X943_000066 [Babesia divergens]